MKKNKGFTLIEVLAVLVILSLLITFSVVSVNKIKKKQEVANKINVIRSILTAARAYEADNPNYNPTIERTVPVNTLLDKGYVDFDQDKYNEYTNLSVTWWNELGTQKQEFQTNKKIYINDSTKLKVSDCGLETSQDTNDKGKLICEAESYSKDVGKSSGWNENGKYIKANGDPDNTRDFK